MTIKKGDGNGGVKSDLIVMIMKSLTEEMCNGLI